MLAERNFKCGEYANGWYDNGEDYYFSKGVRSLQGRLEMNQDIDIL